MDAKALAKSKRAHSQHHKHKSHPNLKLKAPAVASDNPGSKEKQPGKQVVGGTRQARRISKLPSNWDRYEDGSDLDSEDPSGCITSQASDVVVPKSKGADYRHLIAEAQSQSQSQSHSYSDAFPSLDDIVPGGFIRGMGSMLSVRGEGILSWVGDDNFIVEDKTTAFQEASFLSLNLNALAEQLSKVDLSQRLFVEADILPSEPGPEGSMLSGNQESCRMQTEHESETAVDISSDIDIASGDFSQDEEESMAHRIKAGANLFEDKASSDFSEKVKIVDTETSSVVTHNYNVDATFSNQGPTIVNRTLDDLNSSQYDKFGQSKALDPKAQFNEISVHVPENRPKFEAKAAEGELDTLLDSFSDTKFLDFSSSNSSGTSVSREACSKALPKHSSRGPDLTNSATVTASFDDVLDHLLEETSNFTNLNGLSQPQDVKVNPLETQSSSSQSVTKSKVLDDFESWLDTI